MDFLRVRDRLSSPSDLEMRSPRLDPARLRICRSTPSSSYREDACIERQRSSAAAPARGLGRCALRDGRRGRAQLLDASGREDRELGDDDLGGFAQRGLRSIYPSVSMST